MKQRNLVLMLLCYAFLIGIVTSDAYTDDTFVGWMAAGKRIFPEEIRKAEGYPQKAGISLAGREYESIQLLVSSKKTLNNVRVTFTALPEKCSIKLGLVQTVDIKGKAWPDPIKPYAPFNLKANYVQSIWVTVYIAPGTPAGEHTAVFTVEADNLPPIKRSLAIHVWNFSLPVQGSLKTITCWNFDPASTSAVIERYRFSPGGDGSGDVARPKCILGKDGKIKFDWTEYDKKMQNYFDKGLNCFGLPWWAGDGVGEEFYRMEYTFLDEKTGKDIRIELNPLRDEKSRKMTIDWFRQFAAHLKEKGWFDKAVVYLWDEPGYKPIPKMIQLSKVIKQADPGYKILTTEWPLEELYPAIDIFCTHVVNFKDPHLPTMKKAQAAGKELWWYSCDDPYPCPTYCIPYDPMILRTMGWMNWKYELPGRVYYTFTLNRSKDNYKSPGNGGKGCGLLIYSTGQADPVVSVRLEMHRDGIEDYEYLAILKDRISKAGNKNPEMCIEARKLLVIPSNIAQSADKYTTDTQVIQNRRSEIASMIEKLNSK